jgi:uncharacterized protein YecE (DUF72 family)
MANPRQLALFGDRDDGGHTPGAALETGASPAPADAPAARPEVVALGARLPAGLRLGTCSWSFPGWEGLVYTRSARPRRTADLAREGLAEYARHPLLRTVEIDRSFYAPIPEDDLRRYARQLPPGYRCCFKAPAAVTSLAQRHVGRDPGAPRRNDEYLSVARLEAELLAPCRRAFDAHTGPIILEFPRSPRPLRPAPRVFARDLDGFLAALPRGFGYAVELRDPALLTPAYREVLARRGVAHAYTYWSDMPLPAEQERHVPADPAPFLLVRLMLAPGRRYEDERARFTPFDRLVQPDEQMRAQVLALARRALARGQEVWVLANNKAEGSAPLTLFALAERLASPDAPRADRADGEGGSDAAC